MAKLSKIAQAKRLNKVAAGPRKPMSKVRAYNRCPLCGRPRAFLRKFQMCRICFRQRALRGELTGVIKSSW
jgi:small subunit ribosomal protein S14